MESYEYEPPGHLSDRSKALWAEVVPRRVDHPETLALLRVALEALDLADKCRATIQKEGLTTKTVGSGNVHRHPLLATEREYRAQFFAGWKALNLNWVPPNFPPALTQ